MKNKYCTECGTLMDSDVCPTCGKTYTTSLFNEINNMHELTCHEANITFWSIAFPGIFAVSFLSVGFFLPLYLLLTNEGFNVAEQSDLYIILGMFSVFALVGFGALYVVISTIVKYFLVINRGQEYNGVIMDYEYDNIYLNGRAAQVALIKLETEEGPRLIRYQLLNTSKPYPVGSTVLVKRYKNMFKI